MAAYYNEIEPFAAEWLRNLIKAGLIPDGEVDTRSITDVSPADVRGFRQCHWFAGVAGWPLALRLAGWDDSRPIWTGSCPCQPFSSAGKRRGTDDERHLWPVFFNLIRECRPPIVMGEQVSGKAGYGWLDGVRADLEAEDYACRGVDIPACAVDAPHIRQRLYWVAVADTDEGQWRRGPEHGRRVDDGPHTGRPQDHGEPAGRGETGDGRSQQGDMDHAGGLRRVRQTQTEQSGNWQEDRLHCGSGGADRSPSFWSDAEWLTGADGKDRRAQPGVRLLAHGVPARASKLRAYGNAVVVPLAAEVIKAFMETF